MLPVASCQPPIQPTRTLDLLGVHLLHLLILGCLHLLLLLLCALFVGGTLGEQQGLLLLTLFFEIFKRQSLLLLLLKILDLLLLLGQLLGLQLLLFTSWGIRVNLRWVALANYVKWLLNVLEYNFSTFLKTFNLNFDNFTNALTVLFDVLDAVIILDYT